MNWRKGNLKGCCTASRNANQGLTFDYDATPLLLAAGAEKVDSRPRRLRR